MRSLKLCSSNMKKQFPDNVIGIPVSSATYSVEKIEEKHNLCSSNVKDQFPYYVIGIPVTPVSYSVEKTAEKQTCVSETASPYFIFTPLKKSSRSKQYRIYTLIEWINKLGRKAHSFTHGVREHVRLGPKVSTILNGKLRLGTRILQEGGVEKLFEQIFNVREEEKLLNAFQCYLSTTAGPIAGLLFISTENVAFYSLDSITEIKGANQSENVKIQTRSTYK